MAKNQETTPAAEPVVLSPLEAVDAAIAANEAAKERLLAKRRAIVFRDTVVAGVAVTYNYGRKPDIEQREGTVVGTADVPTGPQGGTARKVTILRGEGVNTAVDTVFLNAILSVGGEDVSAADEGEETPEGEGNDPLNAE